ncbi:MAG: hypothetical protein JW884_06485 [Deltaproteobacteria bacterium]|nr:hypothetical protein [Deltaproteobacteria bacterium]
MLRFPHSGVVSPGAPLISNLNALENVALVLQYHRRFSFSRARDMIVPRFQVFSIDHCAALRNSALSDEERFLVMLLRAAFRGSPILLDRPFMLIPGVERAVFINESLLKIDDLIGECYIIDYRTNTNRYVASNA